MLGRHGRLGVKTTRAILATQTESDELYMGMGLAGLRPEGAPVTRYPVEVVYEPRVVLLPTPDYLRAWRRAREHAKRDAQESWARGEGWL